MTEKENRMIQGRYLEDILAQPRVLQSTLQQTGQIPRELVAIRERLQDGRIKRIVLTGMGASFYSLTPLYIALVNYGYEVTQIETGELIHYLTNLLQRESLVVAVSQSGRSAEILRLLELAANRATLLAITNSPRARLHWQPTP